MTELLYEASPSMVRMNPIGTVVGILLLCAGIAVAMPPVADSIAAWVNLPQLDGRLVSIIGLATMALALLFLLSWYMKTKLDRLVIKKDEMIWTHGLLSKQYTEINMSSIRTVRVTQSVLQRIMGAGDVTVFTSGDLPEVVIRGLPNPDRIRDFVKGEPREQT